jgi:Dyp-type peroxidase family
MTNGPLDLGDVQGIIRRGYGDLWHARFLLLRITDPEAARGWLGGVIGEVTNGLEKPADGRLNIAFTNEGLDLLGLDPDVLAGFSREFREGMTTDHRRRVLGDHGSSAPEHWEWGGPATEGVHCLLLLYAPSAGALEKIHDRHRSAFAQACHEVRQLNTVRLPLRKEHFGFRDGIAQPDIEGFRDTGRRDNTVAAGEFLLGYPNQSGHHAVGPLPFARNGSYLVVRQLEQDVRAFWRFVREATSDLDGQANMPGCLELAAKMVGRWPSGAPLVRHPERDPDAGKSEGELPLDANNDRFGYHAVDANGDRCPMGSHIRRTNPRDALSPNPALSIKNANLHRLLRRGRAYGPPAATTMDPSDMLAASEDDEKRGLHFLCFNADIAQQFEFVQQDWVNNPKFESLFYADADPITGAQDPDHPERTGTFTIQAVPVRRRVTGIPRFVHVRGGGYFFMPSLSGLAYLLEGG